MPDHVSELDAQQRVEWTLNAACAGATTDQIEKIADTAPVEQARRKVEKKDAAECVHVTRLFEGHAVDFPDPWIYWDPANPTDPDNLHPTETGCLAG